MPLQIIMRQVIVCRSDNFMKWQYIDAYDEPGLDKHWKGLVKVLQNFVPLTSRTIPT